MQLHRFRIKKPNLKFWAVSLTLLFSSLPVMPAAAVVASPDDDPNLICTDIKVVYARGSGVEVGSERDYIPFKNAMSETFNGSGLSLSFYELGSNRDNGGYGGYSYPAPGIGIKTWQRFNTSLGALFSGGAYNDYGDSVEAGASEAMTFIFKYRNKCHDSKIVLAGYSQGAQTVSRTLQKVNPAWIYAALTFGDPKLHLPEGKLNLFTLTTPACVEGKRAFSEYRTFVPDCYAYEGILGGYQPYQLDGYSGKLFAYCQWHDVICSSYADINDLAYGHASYLEQGTYARATRDLYNKIFPDAPLDSEPVQNVVFLFDVTDSMSTYLANFQASALSAAERIFDSGGKIAFYTYGDLKDTEPAQICDFSTCTLDSLKTAIKNLKLHGGDDRPESLLSASYTLMKELKWDAGANKSVLVFTDADFLNPDRDYKTLEDVVELSLDIDPVNFYILTTTASASAYDELIARTDGRLIYLRESAVDPFNIAVNFLTAHDPDTLINRGAPAEATISNLSFERTSPSSLRISFATDAAATVITLDDFIAGYTDQTSVEITDLDPTREINLCLSPISQSGFRSAPVCTLISATDIVIPKAPNTGHM